jgi:hypothetical protein
MSLTQQQVDQLKADEAAVEKAEADAAIARAKLASDLGKLTPDPVTPPPVVTPPVTLPAGLGVLATKMVARPKAAIMGAYVPDRWGHFLRVGFHSGGRYDRFQDAIELTGATQWPNGPASQWGPDGFGPTTTFAVWTEQVKLPDGTVGPLPFGLTGTLTLTVDGKPLATRSVNPTDTEIHFVVPQASLPADGLYSVTGLPADWGVLDYPMTSRSTAKQAPQTRVAVVSGSHSWGHRHFNGTAGQYSSAWVPPVFAPVEMPLAPRQYVPWPANFKDVSELTYIMLAVSRPNDVYRPSRLKSGAITTANSQNYEYQDISKAWPVWPALSGKRGRGNIICPTSLRETGRPTGGKVTGTEPWRVFAVDDDGTVRTLAGYEHDNTMPQYTDVKYDGVQQYPVEMPKLIGDWSAIPAARRGFRELWDIAWDSDSTTIDQASPLVGGEHTHVTGPVAFVTDTRNGRVCKLAFSATDRAAPCVVTEFLTGLSAPWGCEIVGNELFVTEQGGRLAAYDKHTGALLRSVVYPRAEGLRYWNGALYVGSAADLTVKLVDPATLTVIRTFCKVGSPGLNVNFVNLAVSKGYVATVTWSNGQFGWPVLFDPSGNLVPGFCAPAYKGSVARPKGHPISEDLSYVTAVSMNLDKGIITWGTVQEGLHRLAASLPTDIAVSPAVLQGQQKWDALDLPVLYGDNGFGLYGLPLPWGQHGPEVDAFLRSLGHT